MSSVQSMRQFVCDRLTAAAQEILGVFEKKTEVYEAEISRQRKLLDCILTPEIKLHRTESIQIAVQKEEEGFRLILQENPNNDPSSTSDSPNLSQIKEELEEGCVTPQKKKLAQQQKENASNLKPPDEGRVPTEQTQPLDPNQSAANKDPQSNTSNKDALSGSDKENSSVSAATNKEHQIQSQNFDEAGGKDNVTQSSESVTAAGLIETAPNKRRDEVNMTLASSAEATHSDECNDKACTSATGTAITPDVKSTDGNPNLERSTLKEKSNNERLKPPTSTQTTPESRQGETKQQKRCDYNITLHNHKEQVPHEKNSDGSKVSVLGPEPTPKETHHVEDISSGKSSGVLPSMQSADETMTANKSSEVTLINKSTKKSTTATKSVEPTRKRKCTDQPLTSTEGLHVAPREESHSEKLIKGCSKAPLNRRNSEVRSVSSETPKKRSNIVKATLTPSRTTTPKKRHSNGESSSLNGSVKSKPVESTDPKPNKKPRNGKITSQASTTTSQSTKSNKGSLTPARNKESAQKQKPKNGEAKSTRSNKLTPRKRQSNGCTNPPQRDQRMKTSGDDNPYKCERCGKVLTNIQSYTFHMKSHTVVKTIECEICGKKFRESWDLNKHLLIHTDDKPYKCDVCKKGFNRQHNLILHVRVHTGEKPFKCNVCDKKFSSSVSLKKHTRVHTGEKPYSCEECGKEFSNSSSLKVHKRVHSGEKPYKCSVCGRSFAVRVTLTRHCKTHTGERPFKCNMCGRAFGQKENMKIHMRIHTGEKPYECETCGDKFSTWLKLHRHKKFHMR